VNEQEQRAYDLETSRNFDELNAWIHRTGKVFIAADTYNTDLWQQLMVEHDFCPNAMFWNETVADATNDARRNAYFGQRAHVFDGVTLIKTYEAEAR
jgi:hypothetical protein